MTTSPGIEPGLHWWEASALTIAPSLLPQFIKKKNGNCIPWLKIYDHIYSIVHILLTF